MSDSLCRGEIVEVLEPFSYRVLTEKSGEVTAHLSRHHFGHRPEDLEQAESFKIGDTVMVRLAETNPAQASLVRVATTEEEWLRSTEPAVLLETVRGAASEQKLRLFACACCDMVLDLVPDGPHRRLVKVLEAYASNRASADDVAAAALAGDDEARRVTDSAHDAEDDPVLGPELASVAKAIWATRIAAYTAPHGSEMDITLDCARACADALGLHAVAKAAAESSGDPTAASCVDFEPLRTAAVEAACARESDLVRDLFPNPF